MHGKVCWHEVYAASAKKVGTFYKGLFGWTAKKAEGLGMPYHFLAQGKEEFGGIAPLDKKSKAKPHWLVYVSVDDIDAAVKKVATLKGKVMQPIFDLPMGRIAVVADPEGAVFGLYQATPG